MNGYVYNWHLPKGNKIFESTTYGENTQEALNAIKNNHPKRIVVTNSLKRFVENL